MISNKKIADSALSEEVGLSDYRPPGPGSDMGRNRLIRWRMSGRLNILRIRKGLFWFSGFLVLCFLFLVFWIINNLFNIGMLCLSVNSGEKIRNGGFLRIRWQTGR